MAEDVEFEPDEPMPYPRFWLFYHVALKGLQAGSIAGLATFALRIPSLIKSSKQNNIKQNKFKLNQRKISAYETPLGTLQRCIFHGTMHAFLAGCMVATYHLSYMSLDIVQDRTFRIFNAPFQNQVDYLAILGATIGLLCGKFVFKYDKKNDPFVRKSMFQKAVIPTRRMKQLDPDSSFNDELQRDYEKLHKPSIYKKMFSFSWMNPEFRHVISFGCIGISCGMTAHFINTRNVMAPKKAWVYTTQCVM
eukprot:106209_1